MTTILLVLAVFTAGYVAGRRQPVRRFRYWLRWTRSLPSWLYVVLWEMSHPVLTARAVRILWHRRTDPTWTDRPKREPIPLERIFGPRKDQP